MSDDRVYTTYSGSRYHWPDPDLGYLGSVCNGWNLSGLTAAAPQEVATENRCKGSGCAHRWRAWCPDATRKQK